MPDRRAADDTGLPGGLTAAPVGGRLWRDSGTVARRLKRICQYHHACLCPGLSAAAQDACPAVLEHVVLEHEGT